mmetsp:Transcript_8970/g.19803  ORF Transcript_8970/g.19803 Transcript_8970/m.19803 type:complete len:461 (-) Transcript_8970:200-1582(-)
MNWNNLHEVTAQNQKPAPGWLFREICREALQFPEDVPDAAEYLMRCVVSDNRTVGMKACLAIRHLADEVPDFRRYMQRCPEALGVLEDAAEPPKLAQAQSLERPEMKVAREAARRALASCLGRGEPKEVQASHLQERIQGFGNYAPPPEEDPEAGSNSLIDKVAGFVGDALADTVDDFRDKGAIGAVKDGMADAADLIADGLSSVWTMFSGRRNQPEVVEDRICKPRPMAARGTGSFGRGVYSQDAYSAAAAQGSFQGAFGNGFVGASHPLPADFASSHSTGASQTLPKPPQEDAIMEDLLSFDQPSPRGAAPPADLLSFEDETVGAASSSNASGTQKASELKDRGNELVKAKDYGGAVQAYEAAIASLGRDSNEALRANIFANLAMCYLRQQNYRRAIDAASRSIALDAMHAKAHYRRCLAYRGMKMYEEARRDLEQLQLCSHTLSETEMRRLASSLSP